MPRRTHSQPWQRWPSFPKRIDPSRRIAPDQNRACLENCWLFIKFTRKKKILSFLIIWTVWYLYIWQLCYARGPRASESHDSVRAYVVTEFHQQQCGCICGFTHTVCLRELKSSPSRIYRYFSSICARKSKMLDNNMKYYCVFSMKIFWKIGSLIRHKCLCTKIRFAKKIPILYLYFFI